MPVASVATDRGSCRAASSASRHRRALVTLPADPADSADSQGPSRCRNGTSPGKRKHAEAPRDRRRGGKQRAPLPSGAPPVSRGRGSRRDRLRDFAVSVSPPSADSTRAREVGLPPGESQGPGSRFPRWYCAPLRIRAPRSSWRTPHTDLGALRAEVLEI